MRRNANLQIITEAIERLIPGATPAFLSVIVIETLPMAAAPSDHTWTGSPAALAERIFTALYGRPDTTAEASPLARAEDAKRNRDIHGEIGALMAGERALQSAPWYPVRPGDLVHIAYEAAGAVAPAFGETYIVADAGDGLLSMQLLAHTYSAGDADGMVGCFAVEGADDPIHEAWFEVGPQRLTIVRDGRAVHDGAAPRPRPGAGAMLKAFGLCIGEAERYLERGDAAAALARLRSAASLPPCGAPGVMPEHADCARWKGHGGVHSPDADYTEPPHECPTLPEQLHAVVTVGAKVEDVHLAGLYEDQEAAADHAMGFHAFRAELDRLTERFVKPAPGAPGEMVLELPAENEIQATGVQLAVVVPLQILPDPRAEDEQEDYDYGDPGDDYDDWGDE